MATRQQPGSIGPVRPRAGVRQVYEEFTPISEWKQEEQSEVLLVYLPGFVKEQIKIFTEGTNTLSIRGEQLVGGNKWRRFQHEFHIPDGCNIRGTRAKFEAGTLTITIPKTTSAAQAQVSPKEETKTTHDGPSPQEPSDASRRVADKSAPSPSPQETASATEYQKGQDDKKADRKGLEELTSQKAATETKVEKGRGDQDPPIPTSTRDAAKIAQEDKKADGKGLEEPTSQKGRGHQAPPIPTSSRDAAKIVQDTTKMEERSEAKEKPSESKMHEIASEKIIQNEKESSKNGKESIKPNNALNKTMEKEREESKGTAIAKEKQPRDVTEGGFGMEKYKQAVKGLIAKRKVNEERELIANMGAAILVIVALGAYISYTLGSGKTEN